MYYIINQHLTSNQDPGTSYLSLITGG